MIYGLIRYIKKKELLNLHNFILHLRPRRGYFGGLGGFSFGTVILVGLGAILVIGGIVALALIPLYIRSSNKDSSNPRSIEETLIIENLASLEKVERLIVNNLDATEVIHFVCIFNIYCTKFYIKFFRLEV